ncbi:hypothetical protein WN55_00051 [Dufourea novaeangliae]|uniref:Uncharacterized protein n=1 Tax=Dufourea novaeangliae TaxID=178035 RepID=A0A154NWE2_DUFNO|nr:hypothetical protein WN55_00051 [Dufourea novaeangliae]
MENLRWVENFRTTNVIQCYANSGFSGVENKNFRGYDPELSTGLGSLEVVGGGEGVFGLNQD